MEKILGLDLGTNSIGWAIRDTSEIHNQIIDKGVLTFNEGVSYVKDIEQPKVKVRTDSRGRRRNYQAEKYRKWELLECLIENKMCPLSIDELNEWRHYKKGVGRTYPQSVKFIQWLRFDFNGDGKPDFEQFGFSKHENCYLFRWLSVSESEEHKTFFRDNPQLLGRVFYQLVQRRGFQTNDNDDPETKLIEEGRKNDQTKEIEVVGIKVIDKLIKEKYKTLGAALYWGQRNNELEEINSNRIRNRFTYRRYFENEIDLIFENLGYDKQSEFCKKVKKSIVWQRPLRSQKGLVGYCTLDAPLKSKTGIYYKPGKRRIPLSHPIYEEYRTWCFINNLKIQAPEGKDNLDFINEVVCPLFNRSTDFYFSDRKDKNDKVTKGLKTKIEEAGGKIHSNFDSNLDEDQESTRFNANSFQFKLEKLFGKNWKQVLKWNETLTGIEKSGNYLRAEDIWHLFYDTLITKKEIENLGEKLIPILQKHFPDISFDKKDFEGNPPIGGYASLSAASIRKILPYLNQGMIYSQAVFVANLEKVFHRNLDKNLLEQITIDFSEIVKKHKSDHENYNIVNNLISDRLHQRDRLGMGDDYVLDKYDHKDINDKIKDSFKSKLWNRKTDKQKKEFIENVSILYQSFLRQPIGTEKSKVFFKIYRISDKLQELLIGKYKVDPKRIEKYLWHPSEQEKYSPANVKKDLSGNIITDRHGKEIYFLGDPNPISRGFKNPMAIKTLQILKKHLNYLLQINKIDANTKIAVEIARELNDANRRKAIEKFQGEKRRERDNFKKLIDEYFEKNNTTNKNISEELLDRYELWNEQSKRCLYCAQPIKCSDVMNGTAQIEHTIPAKISNCDELFNLTLAHPECNAQKAKRFPTQWEDNYENIKNNIRFIYASYKKHEGIYKETFDNAKRAHDKDAKDRIIQKRHFHKMYLDYWRKKYETFTITEVTNQFRRQQLTDTQIITKYALPYLKTVFNRIDVQKGATTAKFRKIFQVEPKSVAKDRTEHSHHAIDAAVLTLIPPSSIRDNMMKDYNDAVDKNTLNNYERPRPKNWNNFHQSFITSLKDEVVINHLSDEKMFQQSRKYQRRKGQFVPVRNESRQILYETDKNGDFIYHTDKKGNIIYKQNEKGEFILDDLGNKTPIKKAKRRIQTGTTTRGKLHDESFFGMIKMPETEFKDNKFKLKITDGKLTFKQNEKRKDNLFVVKRIRITDIKNLDDFEKIVIDPNLGLYLKQTIERRIKEGTSFEKAIIKPIYAFGKEKDKNGNQLQPIRHIRCKVKGGGGGYINNPAEIKNIEKSFESKKEYKRKTYALNAETPICALYEWEINGERKRELNEYSIMEVSKSFHFNKSNGLVELKKYETKGQGKKKLEFVKKLTAVLKPKQQVIFYKKSLDELKELYDTDKESFVKRIYSIVKFVEGKVFFKYHLTSLSVDDISKEMEKRDLPKVGYSKVDFDNPILSLKLSQRALDMAIEGTHFEIKSDGEIKWLF